MAQQLQDNSSTIHTVRLDSHFTITSNKTPEDDRLSFAAKGLLWYLLSRPSDWYIYTRQLSSIYKGNVRGNGKEAIENMMKELKNYGYLKYTKSQNQDGTWQHRYDVYPVPHEDFKIKFPEPVKPALVKPAIIPSTERPRNDRKKMYLKNDIVREKKQDLPEAPLHRSSSLQDSIVSFDPSTYEFPGGTRISARMQNAIKKYSESERELLQLTIGYFEKQIEKGTKPKGSYEQMLQGFINGKYAQQDVNHGLNQSYARFVQAVNPTLSIKILKSVVQYKRSVAKTWETLSLNLPEVSFSDCLENFVKSENRYA